jgi:transaldolase
VRRIEDLRVSLFCDGANLPEILAVSALPWVRGFTTNPTLMRRAGVLDYEAFARNLLRAVPDRPVSLEVFADDETEMEWQALALAAWGANVFVKVPVTSRDGAFLGPLIRRLSKAGVLLNVTAILTLDQVEMVVEALTPENPAIVSVFAGRIADTGVDPLPLMIEARRILRWRPRARLLWASPRELLNVFQSEQAGCDIITLPPELLRRLDLVGKDLNAFSQETVEMFYRDAQAAAYRIDTSDVLAGRYARPSTSPAGENDRSGVGKIPCGIVGARVAAGAPEQRA